MTRRTRNNTAFRRSGFEDQFESNLKKRDIDYKYESETFEYEYLIPAKRQKERYTPDFPIITKSGKKIYIETKGRLTKKNRDKYLRVVKILGIDLRFVFQRNNRISRGAKMRYSDWAEKNGFKWAMKTIPDEWLME